MPKARKRGRRIVVETKQDTSATLGRRSVTYQRELVTCGKAKCGKLHGPYWYAYWRTTQGELFESARVVKRYIGKHFKQLTRADVHATEKPKAKSLPKKAGKKK